MRKIITLALFAFSFSISYAQKHFTVEEHFNNRPVEIKGKTAIVDINSDLEIKLDVNAIATTLAKKLNVDSKISTDLAKLNRLLENEIVILQELQPNLYAKSDQTAQIDALGKVSTLMSAFLLVVINDPILREDANIFIDEHGNLSTADKLKYPTSEAYLITKFSQKNKQIISSLKAGSLGSVRVTMKAYLSGKDGSKRKVHISNFDDYLDGDFYEVPRWVTSFSQEDIENFNAARDLGNTANELINSSLANIKILLASKLQSIAKIKALLAEAKDIRDNRTTYLVSDIAIADEYLGQMESEISAIDRTIDNLKNLQGGNVLEIYNTLMQQFVDLGDKFDGNTRAFAAKLTVNLTANSHLQTFAQHLTATVTAINDDVKFIKSVKQVIVSALKPISKTIAAAAEVSGSSFSHSLADLPDLGKIDLKKTGKRQNGDELEISIYYSLSDTINKRRNDIEFDYKKLYLQQVNFYSVASVSLVLANPYNKSTEVKVEKKFQFAPAASLLLKFGSRASPIWNAISPGIGIIFPTPDLDLDGSPDFSFGGTATVFRDIVSIGLSYDTRTDSPFWHIGFSLPFTIIGGVLNRPATTP